MPNKSGNHNNNTGRERGQPKPNERRVSIPKPLLILDFRRLNQHPFKISPDRRLALFFENKRYKGQLSYLVFKADLQTGQPVDAFVVKTDNTFFLLDAEARRQGLALLVHPQPISIPSGFWQEWKREAKTPAKRLELIRKHGLAKDKSIFALTRIIIDIDQPYETAEEKVLKVFGKLGIVRGFVLGKSKSGNLRGIVYLAPTTVLVGYEVELGQRVEIYKHFYLSPHTKHDNGHTHYENFKEFLAILYGLLEREGLKVDWSFFDRVNHPIWWSRIDTRFFTPILSRSGTTRFYTLYNRAKEVQAREGLWEVPRRGKPFNLIQHFWPQHYKPREEKKIEKPAFVRNEFDVFSLWKKAVETLAQRHPRGGRFLRVIVPAVGWAKYLNLSEHEVEDFLEDLLPDKRRDIQIAWKWARELSFDAKGTPRSYKLSDYLQKALDYIQSRDGKAKRQELLTEVFHGQVWLLELVMKHLEKKGYVDSHTERSGKRGRPSKVYALSKPLECGSGHSQAVEPQAPHEALTNRPDSEEGFSGQEFSLYTNSPLQGRAIHEVDGLGVVGKQNKNEKTLSRSSNFLSSNFSNFSNFLTSNFLSERAKFLRKREEGQTVDDLPSVPISRFELRKALFRRRATSGAVSPEVLRLVESVRQAVRPHYSVEFYADQSKLYLYLCDHAQAFKRLEIDLSGGLSYAGVLQIANEVKQALQEVQSTIQNTVEEKQDEQTKLLESFLYLAGLGLQDIREVVDFACQIKGLGWKVQGSRLRWLIDGIEVEGLDIDLWELRSLSKEEAKERVLIAIERVAEIEPRGG